MSSATISSISPVLGAPGTAITLTGTGFTAGAQCGCPALVNTVFVSSTELTAVIPQMEGPAGVSAQGSILVSVFVINGDQTVSNSVPFTVLFPRAVAQGWTTIDLVCGEVPSFVRGGNVPDKTIINWIESVSQSVSSCLLRRGLPLDPTMWQQANPLSADPSAAATLELITRYGAASRLVAAISSQFSGGSNALQVNLQSAFTREFQLLSSGGYDKLFQPAAATEITGQSVASNLQGGQQGHPVFRKDKVF
jgi:hypothetical protein